MSTQGKRRLSVLDATFLRLETDESPMHVASLQVFRIPDDAPDDFVHGVVALLRADLPVRGRFGLRLERGPVAALNPTLAPCQVDLEYHIRHSSLPAPGGERELGELVSHLHTVALDRSRPLWTCHVIEGLAERRFAIYIKIHHSLTDGVGGMRLVTQALATEPDETSTAPWHHVVERAPSQRSGRPSPLGLVSTGLSTARGIAALATRREAIPVRVPFQAPVSALNGPITGARRVATQQVELARLVAVARATETSLNDVFLATCAGALRMHLQRQGLLPSQSLVAGVPVSLRQPGSSEANAVGFLWADLGTAQADPCARLRTIHDSMSASKDHLSTMSPSARKVYTMLTIAPMAAVLASGLGARVKPPMNVTISNVPGPDRARYLNGARLEAFYPFSIPMQGQGLNITCVTYDGKLNIGFTGCRDTLPHLQRLAIYATEALSELERAAGLEDDTSAPARHGSVGAKVDRPQ